MYAASMQQWVVPEPTGVSARSDQCDRDPKNNSYVDSMGHEHTVRGPGHWATPAKLRGDPDSSQRVGRENWFEHFPPKYPQLNSVCPRRHTSLRWQQAGDDGCRSSGYEWINCTGCW